MGTIAIRSSTHRQFWQFRPFRFYYPRNITFMARRHFLLEIHRFLPCKLPRRLRSFASIVRFPEEFKFSPDYWLGGEKVGGYKRCGRKKERGKYWGGRGKRLRKLLLVNLGFIMCHIYWSRAEQLSVLYTLSVENWSEYWTKTAKIIGWASKNRYYKAAVLLSDRDASKGGK